MADIVDEATRSKMMSGIRGKNTKPEILIRQSLHKLGFRYRLHDRTLPGTPDMVFPKFQAVIFVHGCFWHAHNCRLFKLPSTRPRFWIEKLNGNRERDQKQLIELHARGWRTLVIWECATKRFASMPMDRAVECIANWLRQESKSAVLDSDGIHVQR